MRTLALILSVSALPFGGFSQGLVFFNNTPQTLVSATAHGSTAYVGDSSEAFYFALLTSSNSTGPFEFTTGVYATNGPGGRIVGGIRAAAGWPIAASSFFEIVGWSSTLGHDFDPTWLTEFAAGSGPPGLLGVSGIGAGTAGGTDQSGNSFPPFPLFGGTGAINLGFNLVIIPEPSSLALAGLGTAALLMFVRRKRMTRRMSSVRLTRPLFCKLLQGGIFQGALFKFALRCRAF